MPGPTEALLGQETVKLRIDRLNHARLDTSPRERPLDRVRAERSQLPEVSLRQDDETPMIPRASYRFQFHRDFTFADAEALVP